MKTFAIATSVLVISKYVLTLYAFTNNTNPTEPITEQCEVCVFGVCSGISIVCPPSRPLCASAAFTVDGLSKKISTCKSATECPSFVKAYEKKANVTVILSIIIPGNSNSTFNERCCVRPLSLFDCVKNYFVIQRRMYRVSPRRK